MGDSTDKLTGGRPLRLVASPDSSGQAENSSADGASGGRQNDLDQLVLDHQGLVFAAFARLAAEGMTMEREELLAFGQQGLVEAALRYDASQGPFARFASYRVRGAMIDGMRRMGPWTRRGYERARMMNALDSSVESLEDGQQDASSLDSAQAGERLRQHMASMVTAMAVGVLAEPAYEGTQVVSKDTSASAEEVLVDQQLRTAVREALNQLPEPDGTIIRRHYLGGERLDLVARDLGFSKSWASRIHSRALKRLGTLLRAAIR